MQDICVPNAPRYAKPVQPNVINMQGMEWNIAGSVQKPAADAQNNAEVWQGQKLRLYWRRVFISPPLFKKF